MVVSARLFVCLFVCLFVLFCFWPAGYHNLKPVARFLDCRIPEDGLGLQDFLGTVQPKPAPKPLKKKPRLIRASVCMCVCVCVRVSASQPLSTSLNLSQPLSTSLNQP